MIDTETRESGTKWTRSVENSPATTDRLCQNLAQPDEAAAFDGCSRSSRGTKTGGDIFAQSQLREDQFTSWEFKRCRRMISRVSLVSSHLFSSVENSNAPDKNRQIDPRRFFLVMTPCWYRDLSVSLDWTRQMPRWLSLQSDNSTQKERKVVLLASYLSLVDVLIVPIEKNRPEECIDLRDCVKWDVVCPPWLLARKDAVRDISNKPGPLHPRIVVEFSRWKVKWRRWWNRDIIRVHLPAWTSAPLRTTAATCEKSE